MVAEILVLVANMQVIRQLSIGGELLKFSLSLFCPSYFEYASSEGSDETARLAQARLSFRCSSMRVTKKSHV